MILTAQAPAVPGPIPLGPVELAAGGALVLVAAALSLALRLGVARRMLWAALRLVVQLLLVGFALELLFAANAAWGLLAAAVMIGFAGQEVAARQERRLAGWWAEGIGAGAMFVSSVGVTTFALAVQIRAEPWYDLRYAIPLLGMVLGNTMTGIALGLNALTTSLSRDVAAVEARLILGASWREASRPMVRLAMRTALLPIVNRMAATGVVFLPGMMTGQIVAGGDPQQAVRYQLLITFLIAGGTAIGAALAVEAGARRLTDERERLRLDRLRSIDGAR